MNNNLTSRKTVERIRLSSVKAVLFLVCTSAGITSVMFSAQISESILRTAASVATTVLPSLFPFMVISSFMTGSGLCSFLEIFPGKLLERTAGIKKEVTGAVVLGFLSGFPIGASSVCGLYKSGRIGKRDAEVALCQAHNTGPGFPISFIGTYLWGSTAFGVCIYFSQIISMILLSRIIFKRVTVTDCKTYKSKTDINYTKALSDAIASSAASCINICASVVFWKTVCGFFTVSSPAINAGIISLFEFSSGSVAAAGIGGTTGVLLTGFAVGFGGLAALFQAAGLASDSGLSIGKAFLFKALQGTVCALLCSGFYVLLK